jgi:hypothetical protein
MSDMAEPIQLTVKQFKEMAARIEDSETAMIEFYIDEGGKDHEPLDLIRIGQFHVVPDVVFTFRKPSGQSSLSEKEAEIERLRGALEEKTAKVLPVEGKKHPFQSIMDHAEETEPEIKAALNSNGFWDMLDDNPVSEGKEDEQEIIKDLLEDIEIMRGKTSTRHVIVKVIMERYHITRK